jgi:regulator of protease activity HflC (stomatin/prohibitin superfamily)
MQEVRYSDAVKTRFEEAQNAQTEVVKAQADLEKAKVDAQQKIAVATAEAEANRILTESLTPQVLQQRYYDVLAGANLIVVPEGFTALGNLGTTAPQ